MTFRSKSEDVCPRGDNDEILRLVHGGAVDKLHASQSQLIQFHCNGTLLAKDVAMDMMARSNLDMDAVPAADAVGNA